MGSRRGFALCRCGEWGGACLLPGGCILLTGSLLLRSAVQRSVPKGGDCCKAPDGFDAAAFTKGNALGVACGYTMLQANTQMLESL